MTRPRWTWTLAALAFTLAACTAPPREVAQATPEDPYLWLEEVTGERALAWVRERNAGTEALLAAQPRFQETRERLRSVLQSRDRIAYGSRIGAHIYNFWSDAANPRGLWRRTAIADFEIRVIEVGRDRRKDRLDRP